jgi:hypothetical protein
MGRLADGREQRKERTIVRSRERQIAERRSSREKRERRERGEREKKEEITKNNRGGSLSS